MTLDLERIRAAVLSANPAELRRWVEALRRLCIPCQWTPPRHCGQCPCCRQPEPVPFDGTQPVLSVIEGDRLSTVEGPPVKRYRFYRLIRGQKIYFFSRLADTFNPANAAPYTEADWEEWGEREGLQREVAEDE